VLGLLSVHHSSDALQKRIDEKDLQMVQASQLFGHKLDL
jgi:hypothetical protein